MKKVFSIFVGIILFVWLIGVVSSIGSHKSLAKIVDKSPEFEYSTSLTSNYDHSDKAKVYSTKMGVPETARYLMDQDKPEDYTDLDNEEAIQLTYDDYYILIYQSEDGKTYVQISSRKYIHNNGYHGLYRPYRNNIIVFYDRSYTTSRYYGRDTSRYGDGYARPVKSVKSTSVTKKPDVKTETDTNKIKTDKNASSKIRTQNSSTTSTKSSTSSNTSSSTKSVRSGSIGTKSRVGGGTSFGK